MRNDAENIRILEQLRPEYDQLKTAQIKVVSEIERLEAEIAQEEARVLELLGTHDQKEMEALIHDGWKDNTAVVDEFKSIIDAITTNYRQLNGSAPSSTQQRPPQPVRPSGR